MSNILDYQEEKIQFQEASRGTRFVNFIVDSLFLALVSHTFLTATGLQITGEVTPEMIESDAFWNAFLKQQFLQFGITIVYYIASEYLLEGKTAGKYLTRTKAVQIDGQNMDFATTLLRSLVRFVPFEPFSFLGQRQNGWHDRWTKTLVIQE